MQILVCKRCSHRFAFGLSSCPMCTGESAYLVEETEGDEMGKSTIHGTTVEGGDGVTRHVDSDGNIAEPISPVEPVVTEVAADEPAGEPTQVDTTKAPAKSAARGRSK